MRQLSHVMRRISAVITKPRMGSTMGAPRNTAKALSSTPALTIASLRARLRNLSADQVAQLVDYEKSHANREDVVQMFERRIAKLAGEQA